MKFPWVRQQTTTVNPPKDNRPRLDSVEIVPVLYEGEAIAHRIVMNFDRKSLEVGRVESAERAAEIAAEITEGLLDDAG